MLLSPFVEDIVDLVLKKGSGGDNWCRKSKKYMTRFHDAGITVIPVVLSCFGKTHGKKIGADSYCRGDGSRGAYW